jgi:hypothetical protein
MYSNGIAHFRHNNSSEALPLSPSLLFALRHFKIRSARLQIHGTELRASRNPMLLDVLVGELP